MIERVEALDAELKNSSFTQHAYAKHLVLAHDTELGKKYWLQYAEGFHYVRPERSRPEEYIQRNAVPLKD